MAQAVALDISKAFDKMWDAGLLHQLRSYGVQGDVLAIIASFLKDRKLRFVVDSKSSSDFAVNTGVPQGSILGPTVFLLFINIFLDDIISRIGICADDSTVYSCLDEPIDNMEFDYVEMAAKLHFDLRTVVEWGEK